MITKYAVNTAVKMKCFGSFVTSVENVINLGYSLALFNAGQAC